MFSVQIHRYRSFDKEFHWLRAEQYTNHPLERIMWHGLWLQHIRIVDMEIEFGRTDPMHFGDLIGWRSNSTAWSSHRFIVLFHHFDDSVRHFGVCRQRWNRHLDWRLCPGIYFSCDNSTHRIHRRNLYDFSAVRSHGNFITLISIELIRFLQFSTGRLR